MKKGLLLLLLLLAAPLRADDSNVVTVQIGKVVRPVERRAIGLNLNYICDHADVRDAGQGLVSALQKMGTSSLRYPGGEKADGYLWSVPPFDRPNPTLARVGPGEWPSSDPKFVQPDGKTFVHRPLDFDEFMDICTKIGATPTIVVAYDSIYKPAVPGGTAPNKQQLLDTAVAWVKYANVEKKYGIKYWEIGNESYLDSYNGGATADNYARDLTQFAQAMKQVDPSILIGANMPDTANKVGDYDFKAGNSEPWWEVVLQNAAPSIDFVALHTYPCYGWKSFDDFPARAGQLASVTREARKALQSWASSTDAARIRFCITEFNAINYDGYPKTTIGWPNDNNLGHALVDFDIIGNWLLDPKVDMAEVWNSRWTHNDVQGTHEINDTFDNVNNPLPTGMAIGLWSKYVLDQMNAATASSPAVRCFASSSTDGSKWSVFLINISKAPVQVKIPKTQADFGLQPQCVIFSGSGPDDTQPQINEKDDALTQDSTSTICPVPPAAVAIVFSQ